jgi:hypothetical protein
MKRILALALPLAIACLPTPSIRADGPGEAASDEANKLAVKLLDEGAAVFDTFSAKAMTDFYTEDAEVALVTRDDAGLKTQVHKGKAEIEKFYAELFKKPETIKSKNHVEYAKLIAPDTLVIAGTFDTNTLKPDSPKIPFYQVRVRTGDKWLMSSVRIFFVPSK